MLASSFTEHLREIIKVKWNCLPAMRASHVRRDAGHVDVEGMAARLFFFLLSSVTASCELAKYQALC